MTHNEKINELSSQNADEKEISPEKESQEAKETKEIESLKAELANVKEVLKAMESPQKPTQNTAAPAVKQVVANDFKKIDRLVSLGRLNPEQGAILKTEVLDKAFGKRNLHTQTCQPTSTAAKSDSFIEFEKSNPDFFSSETRKLVKSYLEKGFENISQEELSQIADLIKIVEESAIKEHEQSKAHESAVLETNKQAKKRLSSNALMSAKAHGEAEKRFSREEIGKMSPEEFRKHEGAIMKQLRKGQIK